MVLTASTFLSTENDEYPLDLWKVIFLFILYHGI